MRIISGIYGGLKLDSSSDNLEARPTTDRVRESLFSILESMGVVSKRRVLDLFAGFGTLGLEALSRGSSSCVFVEKHRHTASVLQNNIDKIKVSESCKVIVSECNKAMQLLYGRKTFDLIFADPPYGNDLGREVALNVLERSLIVEKGVLILESQFPMPESIIGTKERLKLVRYKGYGRTKVWIYLLAGPS